MTTKLRNYRPQECGSDGYPLAWHRCTSCLADPSGCEACNGCGSIKAMVRAAASHRCVCCGHPYRNGQHGNGEWSPCDECCEHGDPVRWVEPDGRVLLAPLNATPAVRMEARWRILTVHHLTGDKADCRWWNLAALCQRCHLTIQGRVNMAQVYLFEHDEWFKPYAAGYYAWAYLGEELDRDETMARLDELLALECRAGSAADG